MHNAIENVNGNEINEIAIFKIDKKKVFNLSSCLLDFFSQCCNEEFAILFPQFL